MAQKRIEVIAPHIKLVGEEEISFEAIVNHANGKQHTDSFKDYQLTILDTTIDNCIVGIVNTGQNKNLPPKKEKATGKLSKLDIDIDKENLSFGNILLYDTNLNILFYEVNMNGCSLDKFSEYLVSNWNYKNNKLQIELSFNTVSRKGEYNRMLKMTHYTEYYAEFYSYYQENYASKQ